MGADTNIKNDDDLTPYQFHKKKKLSYIKIYFDT